MIVQKTNILYLLSVQQKIYDGTSAIIVHKEDPLNKHILTIMPINQVFYPERSNFPLNLPALETP